MTLMADTQSVAEIPLSPAFILGELDVYNWGPFDGRHSAEIDPMGTAIIGPTGSGKTTLVDAVMTLIAQHPKYNLASTGGHESDRDLISYVRGLSGAGNNSGDNSHVARTGKTSTVVSATFGNGDRIIRLGAIFWIDGTSFANSDLKRLWIFSECERPFWEEWLTTHHEGGARALKKLGKETVGLRIFDSKKQYLAQVRRFFEVGENAFSLLNRAAGLKQLNSINEIFRELVLDDHSAFQRAIEVAAEFDDLAAIREELEIAREQQKSLIPIERTNLRYQTCYRQLEQYRKLLSIIPVWFATAGHRLWEARLILYRKEIISLQKKIETEIQKENELRVQVDASRDIYLQSGGARVEQIEDQIKARRQLVARIQKDVEDYLNLIRYFGLDETLTSETFTKNQRIAGERKEKLQSVFRSQEDKAFEFGAELRTLKENLEGIETEIKKIKARPGSNIPAPHQDFRADLAAVLDLPEDHLPFIAEMVAIKPEDRSWRGAIERAIGGHRLRILIPPPSIEKALRWVNHRENKLHIRLFRAKTPEKLPHFWQDGYTRKLVFKKHPYIDAIKLLLSRIDRHCVDSPETLRDTPSGLTAEGLMSNRGGLFEKQDQRRLTEGWMTGFSNKDRLLDLRRRKKEIEARKTKAQADFKTAKRKCNETGDQIHLLSAIEDQTFDAIDVSGSKKILADLESQLRFLKDPESTVGKALETYQKASNDLAKIQNNIRLLENMKGSREEQNKNAQIHMKNTQKIIGNGLTDEESTLAKAHLPTLELSDPERLDPIRIEETRRVENACERLEKNARTLELNLVRQMGNAKKIDTGALAETGSELQDIPDYLERLRVLNEEALPEKRHRFLSYLNHSSDQGVTQLLTEIQNEVSIIEERIADLNNTLTRVDFNPGNYLQLKPTRIKHQSLTALESAQRRLRSAALRDDDGESHYRALKNVIQLLRDASEKKRTVGARALLDPRYRLQFAVSVIDRHTDKVIEDRTGSQGGSGGEKEIIASYILTASLSYALCPDGATYPLFATIILDEAFSKSSQAVAGRIIAALREFGLHPLFVTPNKEMSLLRAHTRSAILVYRKGKLASLTSLSWEELEAHAVEKIKNPQNRSLDEVSG